MKEGSRTIFAILAFLAAAWSAPVAVLAAGDPSSSESAQTWASDPAIDAFGVFTAKKDWAGAAAHIKAALDKAPGNADYHNLYAYALRKGARPDMKLVFRHYQEALRIDPKHRGAHEYIGEAWLMSGNLAKAKEHLTALDRLCRLGCEEYSTLKKAVAEYERSGRR